MLEYVLLLLLFSVLFIGAIILIAQVASQSSRIRQLEQQLTGLRNLVSSLGRAFEELKNGRSPSQRRTAASPAESAPPAVRPRPVQSSAVTGTPAPGAQQPGAPLITPPAAVPPRRPSRSREEWEALIGGKLLNRIGALALILAVGFFLKYAFDKEWITETARVGIGAFVGLLCLFLAARTSRKGFKVFAQGLVGAGIAILYVTVYASFNFYALVSQGVAVVLMFTVTVVAFLQAFRYNALAVSILGLLGGFLTPFLLQTQETNVPGLFAYLLVLDLGLLTVVMRRDEWAVLEVLAFLGTYATYLSWYAVEYNEAHLWTCVGFLSLVWLLFHGADLIRVRRAITHLADLRRVLAILYAVVFYAALANVLGTLDDETRSLATLGLGALYVASAGLARSVRPPQSLARSHYLASAVILLFAATVIYADEFTLIVLCSLEAVVVVWIGLRIRESSVWGVAIAFLPVVLLLLLATEGAIKYVPLEEYRLLLNERVLAYASLAAAFALGGYWYRKSRARGGISEALHYGWLLLLFLVLSVEANDLFRTWSAGRPELVVEHLAFERTMTLAGVWALVALPLVGFGRGASIRPVFYTAVWMLMVAAGLAIMRALIYTPIEEYRLLLNLRTAVLLIIASASYGVAAALAKPGHSFSYTEEFRSLFRFVPVVAALVFFSTETWDFYRHAMLIVPASDNAAELTRLANLQHLSLSSVWLLFSIALMMLGFWRRDRAFRLQAIALFGIAILKIFLYDLSFLETLYRIFSFVGLGVILLLVSYLYQRYKEIILSPSLAPETPPGA